MKAIGEVIRFNDFWENADGKLAGTIVGYDIHRTKYLIAVHSWDGVPMPTVTDWIFPASPPETKGNK